MISRCPPPTPTPTPPATQTTTVSDPCPLKLTPNPIKNSTKIGNDGQNFPVDASCKIGQQVDCYLAHERGNDPGTDSPITTEDTRIFRAPCIDPIDDFCWLAVEEDYDTPFEREENTDYFAVQCVKK